MRKLNPTDENKKIDVGKLVMGWADEDSKLGSAINAAIGTLKGKDGKPLLKRAKSKSERMRQKLREAHARAKPTPATHDRRRERCARHHIGRKREQKL